MIVSRVLYHGSKVMARNLIGIASSVGKCTIQKNWRIVAATANQDSGIMQIQWEDGADVLSADHFSRLQQESVSIVYKKYLNNVYCTMIFTVLQVDNPKFKTGSHKGAYPFAWLQDNAPAFPTYYFGERTVARELTIENLDLQAVPTSHFVNSETNSLEVEWRNCSGVSYTSSWLRRRNINDQSEGIRRSREFYLDDFTSWNRGIIDREVGSPAHYPEMMKDDGYMAESLVRFITFGFLRVTDVPKESGQVEKFGKRIGYLQNTHYGSIFTVRQQDKPSNQAYTRKPLPLHTDIPAAETPPEIQILHCVTEANSGGLNQFADGFHIAELLRDEQKEAYQLLTTTILEYIDHGASDSGPHLHVAKWPVISLGNDGGLKRVIFSNHQRSWFMNIPLENYMKVYKAMKMFHEYCYQKRNLLEMKINAGDFVMFANNRVLHGRSEYQAGGREGSERHLEGGYLHFDAVKSFIRNVLVRKSSNPQAVLEPV